MRAAGSSPLRGRNIRVAGTDNELKDLLRKF